MILEAKEAFHQINLPPQEALVPPEKVHIRWAKDLIPALPFELVDINFPSPTPTPGLADEGAEDYWTDQKLKEVGLMPPDGKLPDVYDKEGKSVFVSEGDKAARLSDELVTPTLTLAAESDKVGKVGGLAAPLRQEDVVSTPEATPQVLPPAGAEFRTEIVPQGEKVVARVGDYLKQKKEVKVQGGKAVLLRKAADFAPENEVKDVHLKQDEAVGAKETSGSFIRIQLGPEEKDYWVYADGDTQETALQVMVAAGEAVPAQPTVAEKTADEKTQKNELAIGMVVTVPDGQKLFTQRNPDASPKLDGPYMVAANGMTRAKIASAVKVFAGRRFVEVSDETSDSKVPVGWWEVGPEWQEYQPQPLTPEQQAIINERLSTEEKIPNKSKPSYTDFRTGVVYSTEHIGTDGIGKQLAWGFKGPVSDIQIDQDRRSIELVFRSNTYASDVDQYAFNIQGPEKEVRIIIDVLDFQVGRVMQHVVDGLVKNKRYELGPWSQADFKGSLLAFPLEWEKVGRLITFMKDPDPARNQMILKAGNLGWVYTSF